MSMTIADLTAAIKGVPCDAYVLIAAPYGPLPLHMVEIVHIAERDGEMVQHAAAERSGVILKTTRRPTHMIAPRLQSASCKLAL